MVRRAAHRKPANHYERIRNIYMNIYAFRRRDRGSLLIVGAFILVATLDPVSGRSQTVPAARGFTYQHDEIHEKPWSIHIVKVDRSNLHLELHTTLGGGDRFGLGTLSQQIRTMPASLGRVVAGINGDYFRNEYPYEGDPKGLQILRGELVSGPNDWTCFWLDAAREPHMTNVLAQFEVTWPGGEKSS